MSASDFEQAFTAGWIAGKTYPMNGYQEALIVALQLAVALEFVK